MTNRMELRAAELKRRIEEDHGPGDYIFVAVICNGCGRRVFGPTPKHLAFKLSGWRLGPYGGDDYCPNCLG